MAQLERDMADKLDQIGQHLRTTVALALSVGDDLIEAKARLDHGQWAPWLRQHFPLSARTAQAWMRLARDPQRFAFAQAGSVREALALLAPPPKALPPASISAVQDAAVQDVIDRMQTQRNPDGTFTIPATFRIPATLDEAREVLAQIDADLAVLRRSMRRTFADALLSDDLTPEAEAWLIARLVSTQQEPDEDDGDAEAAE
jgi:hypothetical protein